MSENQTPASLTAHDVLNTVGYDGFVRSLFNRSGDPAKDFAHAVLGLVTEVSELRAARDPVNLLEEAGDMSFYGLAVEQVLADFLGVEGEREMPLGSSNYKLMSPMKQALDDQRVGPMGTYLDQLLNELLDHAKRWVGYGKAPADVLRVMALASYVEDLAFRECRVCAPGLCHIYLANIGKLLERYKGMTFSSEHAVNRDLAAERSVLEHAAAA